MVDIPENIAMTSGVQYVFLVIDEVISDLVFFRAVFGEEVLSLVVHGVRHYVTRVMPNDCSIGYRCCCSESDAGVVG